MSIGIDSKSSQTISVLITGSPETGKNMLFCRIIASIWKIPYNSIRKKGLVTDSIKASVLKGFEEDKQGSIREDEDAPLPYLEYTVGSIRYIFYCPVQSFYYERISNSRPIVDILVHAIDPNSTESLENDVSIIKQIRYNELFFCLNKMDSTELYDDLVAKIASYKEKLSKMNFRINYSSKSLDEVWIIPVSSKKNKNIISNYSIEDVSPGAKDTEGIYKLYLLQKINEVADKIVGLRPETDQAIFVVEHVTGFNARGKMVRGFFKKSQIYVLLPGGHRVKVKPISGTPTAFKIKFIDQDMKEEQHDDLEEEKKEVEPTEPETLEKQESVEETFEVQKTDYLWVKRGDVIVSTDSDLKPILNTTVRLLIELKSAKKSNNYNSQSSGQKSSHGSLISKGFKFNILIHSYYGEAIVESLDGTVEYDDKGERTYKQKPLKFASKGDTVVAKVRLNEPIVAENFDVEPVLGQIIADVQGNHLGRGFVLKHVPLKA